jgi:hypothetical protein
MFQIKSGNDPEGIIAAMSNSVIAALTDSLFLLLFDFFDLTAYRDGVPFVTITPLRLFRGPS